MKKDFLNVGGTFLLIGIMLVGSTYIYTKKALAEKTNNEELERQEKIKQEELGREQDLKIQKEKEERDAQIAEEQLKIEQALDAKAKQKAIYDAQQAEAIRQKELLIAQQEAETAAKIAQQEAAAAAKLAQQQAAQEAAKKQVRRSRAS